MKQEVAAKEIASARKTITDEERELSKVAFKLFKDGIYDNCLQEIKKLIDCRPHDARVMENKCVVEYYISKLTKSDEFGKQLMSVKKQLEFGMVNTGDELDDIDRGYLLYNQAVIYFHTKKYKDSTAILERLFKIIEPLDDHLAIKVCILLIEIHLRSYKLEQASSMINFVESILMASKFPKESEKKPDLQEQFQPKLHMFKVRFYMQKQSYNQCKRELKLAMNSSHNSVEALFLKSNLECLRENYQKSIKLLHSAPKASGEKGHPLNVMFYNNMALVHFYMNKINLSVVYLLKGLNENRALVKSLAGNRSLPALTTNRHASLMYNMGVVLLHADKPTKAFDCLMEAQSEYQSNPRYWLRLAEACIASARKKCSTECAPAKCGYVRQVVGMGSHRKIIISSWNNCVSNKSDNQSAAMPSTTLNFANLCLNNANLLLPSAKVLENDMEVLKGSLSSANDGSNKSPQLGRLTVDAYPGPPIHTQEAYNLRSSVLCCHIYVTLQLGDYNRSLKFCHDLLKMAYISPVYEYLARVYLIEVLIKLDRVREAIEMSSENLKLFNKYEEDVLQKNNTSLPGSAVEARAILIVNIAFAYCLRNEHEKCLHVLQQVLSLNCPSYIVSHAIFMSIYCKLRLGQMFSALGLIKRSEVLLSQQAFDLSERLSNKLDTTSRRLNQQRHASASFLANEL